MFYKLSTFCSGLLLKTAKIKLWVFTAVAGAVFGLGMTALTPPFMGPDENSHFAAICNLQYGRLRSSIPESLKDVYLQHGKLFFSPSKKYSGELWNKARQFKYSPEEKRVKTSIAYRNLISYLPLVLCAKIQQFFSDSLLATLYLVRLAGLAVYITLAALAVKITPVGKLPLTLLALMPQSLFAASILNTDYMTFGAVLLFLALFLRDEVYGNEQKISLKSPLFWAGVLLCTVKFPCNMFVFILIFLPWSTLKKSPGTLTVLLVFSLYMVYFQIHKVNTMVSPEPHLLEYYHPHLNRIIHFSGDSSAAKSLNVIQIACLFFERLKYTLFSPLYMGFLGCSFIGFLGYFCTLLHPSVLAIYASLLVFSFIASPEEKPPAFRYKLGMTLASAGAVGAIIFTFFFVNISQSNSLIVGLQGRYFIPAAIFLTPVVAGRINLLRKKNEPEYFNAFAKLAITATLTATLISIYQRFYSDFWFDFYG